MKRALAALLVAVLVGLSALASLLPRQDDDDDDWPDGAVPA